MTTIGSQQMAVGRRSVLRALVAVACAMLLGPAAALADSSPSASLTAAFSPSTVALNGSSTLTFTLTSPAGLAISAAGLEAFVPDGIGLTPVTEGECGGTLSVSESAYENPLLVESPTYGVQLSGASLALGTTCQFALSVVGDAAGTAQLELDGAPYVTVGANPTLTVTPSAQPPVVTASFADPRIEVGQTTDLTIKVENPNPSTTLTALRVQALPTTVAGAGSLQAVSSNTCGGQTGSKAPPPH